MHLYIDVESVGLCGPTKLIQWAIDDGPVHLLELHRGWEADPTTRVKLNVLFRQYIDNPDTCFVAFNAAFDLFKLYNLRHRLMGYGYDSAERPVMPFECKVLDLQVPAMMHSPLAPFAFNRAGGKSVALLRRIPKVAMEQVADRVTGVLKPLLPQSFDLGVGIHKVAKQPDLVTLSFNVKGRLSLKGLMAEYGLPTLKLAECWPLPEKGLEKPWLPYPDPSVHGSIEAQCDEVLRGPKTSAFYRYSELDILYLKVLYEKLNRPEPDYNSDCVHNMAYLRYYGFDLDHNALRRAEAHYGQRVSSIEKALDGVNLRSSVDRLRYLQPHFPLIACTNKQVLKKLAEEDSEGGRACEMILDYGPSRQRLLQIQKVMECRTGRAHPSLRVMGTATDRMAGEAGLNWQGIGAADEIIDEDLIDDRPENEPMEEEAELEELAELGAAKKVKVGLRNALLTPCVGDWASFEVVIAATVYDDPQLKADLQAGIDLHSMTVATAHPIALKEGWTYERVRGAYTDDKHPEHQRINKWRKAMKAIVFGIFYFASAMKVAETLNIPDHEGQAVLDRFYGRYKAIGRYRAEIERRFITADVDGWAKGSVKAMDSEQSALTGFHRRWSFEKSVACALWELGQGKSIKTGLTGKITRTQAKGPQTIDMAITSACLGSAIAIQAAVSRQAGNMPVQATGSGLTKQLIARIWNRLRVPTLNIHDEAFPPHHPFYNPSTYANVLNEYVLEAQEVVPMVKFDYHDTVRWSDK